MSFGEVRKNASATPKDLTKNMVKFHQKERPHRPHFCKNMAEHRIFPHFLVWAMASTPDFLQKTYKVQKQGSIIDEGVLSEMASHCLVSQFKT